MELFWKKLRMSMGLRCKLDTPWPTFDPPSTMTSRTSAACRLLCEEIGINLLIYGLGGLLLLIVSTPPVLLICGTVLYFTMDAKNTAIILLVIGGSLAIVFGILYLILRFREHYRRVKPESVSDAQPSAGPHTIVPVLPGPCS